MIFVEITDLFASQVDADQLARAAQTTLTCQTVTAEADLTLVITDDEQLHQLNLEYLATDAPTDVLSFPADHTDPDTGRRYLGDVLISYPRALAQAATAGHSVADELQLLIVHGVLHLLGHDHFAADEKTRMWSAQAEILTQLGSSITPPP